MIELRLTNLEIICGWIVIGSQGQKHRYPISPKPSFLIGHRKFSSHANESVVYSINIKCYFLNCALALLMPYFAFLSNTLKFLVFENFTHKYKFRPNLLPFPSLSSSPMSPKSFSLKLHVPSSHKASCICMDAGTFLSFPGAPSIEKSDLTSCN